MPKDTSGSIQNEDIILSHDTETTLQHALSIMSELTRWLVISGVGYTEFATVLKALFYNEAIKELDTIQQKKTDSAISLLSGLNRRDVRHFCELSGEYFLFPLDQIHLPINVPTRVISLWVSQKLPKKIPIHGTTGSFESLAKQISSEKHPKSILSELKRLHLIEEESDTVVLQTESFQADAKPLSHKLQLTQNIKDHLAAGIDNLTSQGNFLEQAISTDQLTQESINQLSQLSSELWTQMVETLNHAMVEAQQRDKNLENANKRFRLGIYQYDQQTS